MKKIGSIYDQLYISYPLRKINVVDQVLMWGLSPMVLQFVFSLIARYIYVHHSTLTNDEIMNRIILMGMVGTAISLPLLYLIIRVRKIPLLNRKNTPKNHFGLTKADVNFTLGSIAIGLYVFFTGEMIMQWLFSETEAANQQTIELIAEVIPLWLLFLVIVIVAPITEEWLFRGMIMFRNPDKKISWTVTWISSIAFGAIHFPTNIPSIYSYVGMGFLFAYVAKNTETVESAIVFHFVNNLLAFIALVFL